MKIFKLSQSNDFGGYFGGQVPENAEQYIGSSSVEASQIAGAFNRTNEALQLVNQFSGGTLKNIAFIFNFSKGGAYGVYVPALDKAIKTKALKRILESKGYKVVEEGDMVKAVPTKEEKSPEQIEEEIKKEWGQLSSQGGTAIGVNVAGVLNASSQNASTIMNQLRSSGQEPPAEVQNILQNVLSVYNMAGTIVHEANHTRGGDEGAAESDESAFQSWSQNKKNEQYKKELESAGLGEFFTPILQGSETIHAKSKNWYKTAQFFNSPDTFTGGKPRGSDLEGRFNKGVKTEGMGDWSMLVQRDHHASIEKSLDRRIKWPIDPSISQDNETIESQLRKNTFSDDKPDARLIMEELLLPFHDETASYQTMEEQLENTRPKPLLTPIKNKKTASTNKLVKEATLFGWYNNLSISDGSTIPGMGDRVMAWEDRDECFSQEEEWIEKQPRYNPEYDLKGFYYRWIEPRFKPELWDSMTNDDTANVHPAKRFAGKVDPELVKIINVLGLIQRNISEKTMGATRLIVSEDIYPIVDKFFGGKDGIQTKAFNVGQTNKNEKILAVWIYDHKIPVSTIHKSENYFENKDMSSEVKEISETLLGTKTNQSKAISEIVSKAKEICKEYEIDDLFIIGSYAREKAMGENPDVEELDFRSKTNSMNIKIGNLLAKKLGVKEAKTYENSQTLSFPYKGIKVNFEGDVDVSSFADKDKNLDFSDIIISDLCNRDFTINMLAYNVNEDMVEDFMGVMGDLKNRTIKTFFNPEAVVMSNPMVIMRALKLKLRHGFEIDENLKRAMITNVPRLFSGKYSEGKLLFARESVKEENKEEANRLFEEYGLLRINDLGNLDKGE